MTSVIHVGVSGFSYPAWRGLFYPKDLKDEELLVEYAKKLDSVEINSSFYGAPREETVKNWVARTGTEFKFAFKAPRQITHIMKLGSGAAEAANRFSGILEPLGLRRGPVLLQLPPFLKKDMKLLEAFLAATESIEGRVFEFRNSSWMDDSTYDSLRGHGAGFCIAETEDLEPQFKFTSSTAYFRLRKESYDGADTEAWAAAIKKAAKEAKETFVFLRHDETGENALLAQRLAKAVGA